MKEFKHETGNATEDTFEAVYDGGAVILEVADWRRQVRIVLTRRDLTEIIAGLTAIRDAMPEGE